ncbi:hypothetical protein TWF192_005132 [Orbilia oligospora]|uniref:Uncharacterized protein n=1 Tax=Orbilia oligospora TaxID=2813651 RepID=A0A6G1M9A3_ORBOL|nr:hypothetical protein TWF679_004216 [Orbilia oligospora]KAF3250693.1 hypothetical protein TWF192_005132 [Orbilia oligospora]
MDYPQLTSDIQILWHLLESVITPFIANLPYYQSTNTNTTTQRTIAFLRCALEWVGSNLRSEIYFPYLQDLPKESGLDIYEAFWDALEALEQSISRPIPHRQSSLEGDETVTSSLTSKFPCLSALQTPVLQSDETSLQNQPGIRPQANNYNFQELEEHQLCVSCVRLDTLRETISTIFPKILFEPHATSLEDSVIAAKLAREFGKSAEAIFRVIASQMDEHCNKGHDGFIRVPVAKTSHIEMLLPVCANASAGHLHPTSCSLPSYSDLDFQAWVRDKDLDRNQRISSSQDSKIVICESIRRSKRMRQRLTLQLRDELLWEQDSDNKRCVMSKQSCLEAFIWGQGGSAEGDGNTTFTHQTRAEIPVLLARSMLHLYNTQWFQHLWDMDRLILCNEVHEIPLGRYSHPYLASTLSMTGSTVNPANLFVPEEDSCDPLYRHALVLGFGLRLLEIESGTRFPPTDDDIDPEHEEKGALPYLTLQRALSELEGKGQVEDDYLKIAKACLGFHTTLKQKRFRDVDPSIRELVAIHNIVFSPLLQLLAQKFRGAAADLLELEAGIRNMRIKGEKSNNKKAESCTLMRPPPRPPAMKMAAPEAPRLLDSDHSYEDAIGEAFKDLTNSQWNSLQSTTLLEAKFCIDKRDNNVQSVVQLSTTGLEVNAELWVRDNGVKKPNAQPQTEGGIMAYGASERSYDNWWQRVDTLNGLLRAQSAEKDTIYNHQKVKIAVLDTGISPKHPYADEMAEGLYKDFVDEDCARKQDTNGHGTETLNLIFKAFETPEVYVARVFRTEEADQNTAEHVVKAIEWAQQKNVDIIVMALGFPRSDESIENAINTAAAEHILFFAAAGNWGGQDRVAFPARLDNVLCFFSTTPENKNLSSINPPHNRRKAHNFAILGEEIKVPTVSGQPVRTIRGTSVSCAIAAGVAGSLLDFSRQKICRDDHCLRNLKRRREMSAVFEELSKDSRDGKYDCVAPWKLLEGTQDNPDREAKRRKIFDKLSRVVENSQ